MNSHATLKPNFEHNILQRSNKCGRTSNEDLKVTEVQWQVVRLGEEERPAVPVMDQFDVEAVNWDELWEFKRVSINDK